MRAALGLALAALATASAPAANAECLNGTRDFARKGDLPPGVLAAFGRPMAERGAPFQATDVIIPGQNLPGTRFIAARQTGCRLALRFEQGGIAHTFQTALFEQRGNRWVLLGSRLGR